MSPDLHSGGSTEIWFNANQYTNQIVDSKYVRLGANYCVELIPHRIHIGQRSKLVMKHTRELRKARKLFRGYLLLLKIKRKHKAIMLDRYVIEGKTPLIQNSFLQIKLNNEIKKPRKKGQPKPETYYKKPNCFNRGRYSIHWDRTPDPARIFQLIRLEDLYADTENENEKNFYLLKIGMLIYKNNEGDYENRYRYRDPEIYQDTCIEWEYYDILGSFVEHKQYTFKGDARVHMRGYDLRHNIYKYVYYKTKLDWDYDEIVSGYRKMNKEERVYMRKASGLKRNKYKHKTQYSGHLNPDKFII